MEVGRWVPASGCLFWLALCVNGSSKSLLRPARLPPPATAAARAAHLVARLHLHLPLRRPSRAGGLKVVAQRAVLLHRSPLGRALAQQRGAQLQGVVRVQSRLHPRDPAAANWPSGTAMERGTREMAADQSCALAGACVEQPL